MMKVKKSALNKKMIVISICGGVVIALIITVIGLVIYAFHQQYNSSGISKGKYILSISQEI